MYIDNRNKFFIKKNSLFFIVDTRRKSSKFRRIYLKKKFMQLLKQFDDIK